MGSVFLGSPCMLRTPKYLYMASLTNDTSYLEEHMLSSWSNTRFMARWAIQKALPSSPIICPQPPQRAVEPSIFTNWQFEPVPAISTNPPATFSKQCPLNRYHSDGFAPHCALRKKAHSDFQIYCVIRFCLQHRLQMIARLRNILRMYYTIYTHTACSISGALTSRQQTLHICRQKVVFSQKHFQSIWLLSL